MMENSSPSARLKTVKTSTSYAWELRKEDFYNGDCKNLPNASFTSSFTGSTVQIVKDDGSARVGLVLVLALALGS